MAFCHVHRRGRKSRPKGYPEQPRTLGEHLRRRRSDLGLLQREVAALLGVSAETILGWERWKREPEIRHWPGILVFLDYDPYPEPWTIAQRLKAIRRLQGWSQRELARRMGVDPSAVRDWEAGKEPHLERCRRAVERVIARQTITSKKKTVTLEGAETPRQASSSQR